MKKLALLAVLGIIAALGIVAPTAGATASCSPSATPFVPVNPIGYVAAQMTLSSCTDTKAVRFLSISALVGDACWPSSACTIAHFEEYITGSTNCHLTSFIPRQDWTCGNASGTIGSASLYQYVTRPDLGFAGSCDYVSVIVDYQMQNYSNGGWGNTFSYQTNYAYVCV